MSGDQECCATYKNLKYVENLKSDALCSTSKLYSVDELRITTIYSIYAVEGEGSIKGFSQADIFCG